MKNVLYLFLTLNFLTPSSWVFASSNPLPTYDLLKQNGLKQFISYFPEETIIFNSQSDVSFKNIRDKLPEQNVIARMLPKETLDSIWSLIDISDTYSFHNASRSIYTYIKHNALKPQIHEHILKEMLTPLIGMRTQKPLSNEALEIIRTLIGFGHPWMRYLYGISLVKGNRGAKQDTAKGFKLILKAYKRLSTQDQAYVNSLLPSLLPKGSKLSLDTTLALIRLQKISGVQLPILQSTKSQKEGN